MQDLGADLEANGYRGIGYTEQPMDHLSIRPINPFLGVQQPMGGHTLLGNTPVSTPVFLNLGPQLQPRLTPRPTLASGQENQNRPRPTLASGQVNPNGLSFEFGNPNVRVPNGNPNVRVPTSTTCDAHLPPPVGTPINTAPQDDQPPLSRFTAKNLFTSSSFLWRSIKYQFNTTRSFCSYRSKIKRTWID